LLSVLEFINVNISSVLLGDFNIDILLDYTLQVFMSDYGYSQFIDTLTTDSGALLD